jgi:hypothetical protein
LGLIIKNKSHFLTRFPLGLIVIVVIGLFPVILSSIGGWIQEMLTGHPCSEANCAWDMFTWFTMITIPVGGLLMLVYLALIIMDTVLLLKKR